MTVLHLTLENLHCASCATEAERALGRIPGLGTATVNATTGVAEVSLGAASSLDITRALIRAGYPPRTRTAALRVDGLQCASCTSQVERALSEAPGVQQASVNLATGLAQVLYLPGVTDPGTLAEIVTQAGYPATFGSGQTDATVSDRETEIVQLRRATMWASALT
ncbi:MAG: cation transporter, partial [Pseudomonadota bacterium]